MWWDLSRMSTWTESSRLACLQCLQGSVDCTYDTAIGGYRRVYSNQETEFIPNSRSVEAQPTTHRNEDSGSDTMAIVNQGFLNRNPRSSITFASISVFWEKSPAVCSVESRVFVMSHAPPQKRLFSFFPIDGRGKSQTTHALSEYVVRLSSADKKADRQSQTSCLEVLSILFLFLHWSFVIS